MAMTEEELHEWLMETDVSDETSDDEVTMKTSNKNLSEKAGCTDDDEDDYGDDDSTLASLNDSFMNSSVGFGKCFVQKESPNNSFRNDTLYFEAPPKKVPCNSGPPMHWSRLVSREEWTENAQVTSPQYHPASNQMNYHHHQQQELHSSCPSFRDDDHYHSASNHMNYHHQQEQSLHSSCPSFLLDDDTGMHSTYPESLYARRQRRLTMPAGYFKNAMEQSQRTQEYINSHSTSLIQRKIMHDSRQSREMLMRAMSSFDEGGGHQPASMAAVHVPNYVSNCKRQENCVPFDYQGSHPNF